MNDILDFIRSAAPWVAMGLAVAILAVRGAVKIKKGEKQDSNYGLEGMCLGMCFGTALGTALGNNTGVGLSSACCLTWPSARASQEAGRTRTNEKERKHDASYL